MSKAHKTIPPCTEILDMTAAKMLSSEHRKVNDQLECYRPAGLTNSLQQVRGMRGPCRGELDFFLRKVVAVNLVVKKVINNNILCVTGAGRGEMIVTGHGIGFGRKAGDALDAASVQKMYCMTSPGIQQKLTELLEQIPYEHLVLTDALVEMIRAEVPYPLNESLLVSLADHISFALERSRRGQSFSNPLLDAIRAYYPVEYRLGCRCLEEIRTRTGVSLPEAEAGFIAQHIVNAELNTSMSVMDDITELIEGCVGVTEAYYGRRFDCDSLSFSRFTVHLRFFAQRLFQNQQETESAAERDELFRTLVARNCEKHYRCARQIAAYVGERWHKQLSDEELVFLTIHLKRINLDIEGSHGEEPQN